MNQDENPVRRRGGQPKPVSERKRNNLTFRARDELKTQLAIEANWNGRSLSEEIEHRLEQSFVWEGAWDKARKVLADMGASPVATTLTDREHNLIERAVDVAVRRLSAAQSLGISQTAYVKTAANPRASFILDLDNPQLQREHSTVQ